MRKILAIDGNYFMMRVLGQVNIGDSINNVITPVEQQNFRAALNNSLVNLYKTFNNESITLIDQILFVSDCGSWRKDIEPHRPYYIPETSDQPIGYKEQRKAVKEESPINYDNVYKIYSEFVEDIRDKVVVFKINKLEGDDELLLISNMLKQRNDCFCLVFATDSDLDQIVNNNVMIFRNIRSKNSANGEIVLNLSNYGKIFEQSAMDALLGGAVDTAYYKQLFAVQIGCIDGQNKIHRELNKGISLATPFRTALVKSVAGDKKDNIFSLIQWKSKTGTRNYNITEKIITKALDQHGYSLTEDNCQKILSSKENLFNLLLALKEVTKQPDVDLSGLAKHLKHNLRINMLSVKNVPEELRQEFNKCWEDNIDRIFNQKIDEKSLMSIYKEINYNPKNKGKDVLASSIPNIVEEL